MVSSRRSQGSLSHSMTAVVCVAAVLVVLSGQAEARYIRSLSNQDRVECSPTEMCAVAPYEPFSNPRRLLDFIESPICSCSPVSSCRYHHSNIAQQLLIYQCVPNMNMQTIAALQDDQDREQFIF